MTAPLSPATLPELGPLLGRLVAPPGEMPPAEAALETVRLELLSELFERAGAARGFLSAGDEPGARAALGRATWLAVWEHAVNGAARAILEQVERRIRDAATVSRYPAKRLATSLPDAEERRLLSARLSAAGIGLEEAADRLDFASDGGESLRRVAGELEAAWERITATALAELARWDRRAAGIRAWRRPWRPLVVTGAILLAVAAWLGLVLGGYLTVPGWLRPFAEWIWNL